MESIIRRFTDEEFIELFSTATYGNPAFDIDSHTVEDWNNATGECFEDKVLDILKRGGTVDFLDQYAEDADNKNGLYADTAVWDKRGHFMRYPVTEKDIYERLNVALESAEDKRYLQKIVSQLAEGSDEFDMFSGWNICQFIMFGDYIYG